MSSGTRYQRVLFALLTIRKVVVFLLSNYFYMSFWPAKGDWVVKEIPTKANTTYTAGTLLYNDGTNDVVATTTSLNHRGICIENKTSAANTNPIHILVPRSPQCTMYGDIGSGTPAKADEGKPCDIASGGATVAWGTNSTHQLVIEGYISATLGEFSLSSMRETSVT